MNDSHELESVDAYALGTLSGPEMERVREHLLTCASCRSEYDEIRNVLDVMPHEFEAEPPSAASRERLMQRIAASQPTPIPVRAAAPTQPPWTMLLAAGFALALVGDGWFAWQQHIHSDRTVAAVEPTAAPVATTTAAPTSAPHPAPPAVRIVRDPGLLARIDLLQRDLDSAKRSADTQHAHDAARIAQLQHSLDRESAQLVAFERATPAPARPPVPVATSGTLVAALSSGHVYGVDGVVGNEPWHLTIVQPPDGAHALIYSQVPDAPSGDTYRTWVVRGGKTFDAGELRAATRATLEMPMPLQDGDIVAFTREPIGSGDQPTTPFLMQITIKT